MLQSSKKVSDFSIASLLQLDVERDLERGEVKHASIHCGCSYHHQQSIKISDETQQQGSQADNKGCYVCHGEIKTVENSRNSKKKQKINEEEDEETFSWLSCTRFKPPKLPRAKRKTTSRTQGRGPRIPFTSHQLMVLEKTFESSQYLSSEVISRLAHNLQLTDTRVKIWFQNRRARFRRERNIPSSGLLSEVYSTEYSSCPKRDHQLPSNSSASYSMSSVQSVRAININRLSVSVSESTSEKFNEASYLLSNRHYSRQLINDLNLITAAKLQSSHQSQT